MKKKPVYDEEKGLLVLLTFAIRAKEKVLFSV